MNAPDPPIRVDVHRAESPGHYTLVLDVVGVDCFDFELDAARTALVALVREALPRFVTDDRVSAHQRAAALFLQAAEDSGRLGQVLIDAERLTDRRYDVGRIQARLDEPGNPM